MQFTSQDALDAAERIVQTPRMLVDAPAPPAHAPSPAPDSKLTATGSTLAPGDPSAFGRSHSSPLALLTRLAALIAALALFALSIRP
jgi:hypothetical protein